MGNYETQLYNAGAVDGAAIGIYSIFALVIAVVSLVGMWKVFVKAGKPGWACLIPFYNLYCLFEISFGSGWLFLLIGVPCVGIVMGILCMFKLAKAFGQGIAFGFGLWFLMPIFMIILGFGDAQYVGVSKE